MISRRNSTGFFSREEETITELAARLFSDYQKKRPRRDDLNKKINTITQHIGLLDPTSLARAISLLWGLECEAQAAYMEQKNTLMRKARPSLFAITLESLRDKIYSKYSQVAEFNDLLTTFQESIPEIIAIQQADVNHEKELFGKLVRRSEEHFEIAEECSNFGPDKLRDEVSIKREDVLAAEKMLSVMQKSSKTFNEFVNAKQSSVLKSSS